MAADAVVTAEIEVENTGDREGRETVLWFIHDPAASRTRPLRELRHFESAAIPAGGRRIFRWEIVPARDCSFPDEDGRRIVEPGEIVVCVGDQRLALRIV